MIGKWANVNKKFSNLVLREKALIVGAAVAFIYVLCDLALIQPIDKQLKKIQAREVKAQDENTLAQSELKILVLALKGGKNAKLRKELKSLQSKLKLLDEELSNLSVGLISSDDLPIMLHDVLQKTKQLKLISMKTLPAEEINLGAGQYGKDAQDLLDEANNLGNTVLSQSIKDSDAIKNADKVGRSEQVVNLFKHGVDLTFLGTYSDVAGYITELENGSWRFYWEVLGYEVDRYPKAEIHLKVYTLSSERGAFDAS